MQVNEVMRINDIVLSYTLAWLESKNRESQLVVSVCIFQLNKRIELNSEKRHSLFTFHVHIEYPLNGLNNF